MKQAILLILLIGCSGMEQSEQKKLRRLNAKGEFIHRNHDEYHYQIDTPKHRIREPYPWENGYIGQQTKISKEYFRCKGSGFNPPRSKENQTYFDCGGCHTHSLPLRQGKEFIYPILIDLLNFVQEKTRSKVIITCGHRCPAHNAYADSLNSTSKHMIGAEVDFYVERMQEHPEEIIAILQRYYQENPSYTHQEYLEFERSYHHLDVSVPAWYNKEILIQLYQRKEGRDYDNQHEYPYICIQVRYDKEAKERVIYSWPKAFKEFRRY